MVCVRVNTGSISHVRHMGPWNVPFNNKYGLTYLNEVCCSQMKSCISTKIRTNGTLKLDSIHKEEVAVHRQNINTLRMLCATESNIIPSDIRDFQLVEFLNSVNYDVKEAKEVLEINYKHKIENNALFSMRNPLDSDLQEVWNVVNIFSLPRTTRNREKIVYCGLLNPDPTAFKLVPSMKLFTMAIETTLITEGLYPGYVVILDASNISIRHLPLSAIPTIKKFLYFVQEGIPLKITQVHIINASTIVTRIYNILKPFLKQELIEMLQFHSEGIQSFHKIIPKEVLPLEMGGILQPMETFRNEFKKKVDSLKEWYHLEEQQRREREETV